MSAPGRIWANVTVWGDGEPLAGEWNHCDVGSADDSEFVRKDIADAQIERLTRELTESRAHLRSAVSLIYHGVHNDALRDWQWRDEARSLLRSLDADAVE